MIFSEEKTMLTFNDIQEAYDILKPVVRRTPLEQSKTFSQMIKTNVYLKQENLQTTGSFKIRGAYNKIYHLTKQERKNGVVCASAGNHAQGVAHASTLMGLKSTVYMPIYTSPTKIIATKSYGATVVLEGLTYDDAAEAAKKYAEEKKIMFVHAFNDDFVIAGQGTIGMEIFEALPEIDVVLVPIGGGGGLFVRRVDVLAARQGRAAVCGRDARRCGRPGRVRRGEDSGSDRCRRNRDQRLGLLSKPAHARRGRGSRVPGTPAESDRRRPVAGRQRGEHVCRPRLDAIGRRQLAAVPGSLAAASAAGRIARRPDRHRELPDAVHG